MTPVELETYAKQMYNAVGDEFFPQSQMLSSIYQACMELAKRTHCIQRTYTTTTVSGTQEYAYPTNTMGVRRVTYNGYPLQLINFREDDQVTGGDSATTATGTPFFYYTWNYSVFLRPIPDAAYTLKVYSYSEPSAVTATSTLEVPTEYHNDLVYFLLREMCAKDKNYQGAKYYGDMWNNALVEAMKWERRKKRVADNANSMSPDLLPETVLGTI